MMNLDDLFAEYGALTPASAVLPPTPVTKAPQVDASALKQAVVDQGLKDYYDQLSGQQGSRVSDTLLYKCWHHDDKHASLCASTSHGGYECKSCGKTNDLIGAWMYLRSEGFKESLVQIAEWMGGSLTLPPPVFTLSPKERKKEEVKDPNEKYTPVAETELAILKEAQECIMSRPSVVTKLRDHYGVTSEGIKTFGLGWYIRGQRLMIPVYSNGAVVNIRKHDIMRSHCAWLGSDGEVLKTKVGASPPTWDVKTCRSVGKRGSKVVGIKGHNTINLFPSANLDSYKTTGVNEAGSDNPWIALVGGELKAIFMNQSGIPAVCFTGGEGSYTKAWIEQFRGLSVDICMDADDAGVKAAVRLSEALFGVAAEVRVVRLPEGDPNDYYRTKGWNVSDWYDLPREGHTRSPYDMEPITVTFDRVHDLELAERPVNMHAVIAGGTDRAKFVISGVKATCEYGQSTPIPNCKKCSLPRCGFEQNIRVPSAEIISLSKSTPRKQEKLIRDRSMGIPDRCPHPEIEYTRARVMPVLLAPDTEIRSANWSDQRHFILPTYYLGVDVPRDNEAVEVTGRVCADPISSEVTMIVDRLKPSKRSVYTAVMSDATKEFLDGLSEHPANSSAGSKARFTSILKDMEFGVTRIYDQRVMLSAYLLLFFMPIRFKMFGDENQKVSPEIFVLGDSRQGKTTAANKMSEHFGAGAMIDAEGASYVGLVGGRNEYGSAGKVFSWGSLPMNNGGLVFLDEIDNLIEEGIFGKLTSIRSSGIAQRTIAGGNRRTSAALRMIMASNPKGTRRLAQYDSLLYAAKDLIGKPADLARFELIVGVYKLQTPKFDFSPEPITYTSAIAQEHLRWAWQQTPDLSATVSQLAADLAETLAMKYENLPTLEPTEARWKVGRMACAFAAVAFSRDDKNKLLVTEDHVRLAAGFIDDTYGTPQWKIASAIGHGNIKSKDVKKAIDALGGTKFAKMLKTRGSIRASDIKMAFNISQSVEGMNSYEGVMAILTMYNDCLLDRRGNYYKTEQFRRWLDDNYKESAA